MKGMITQWLYSCKWFLLGGLGLSAVLAVATPVLYNSFMNSGDPEGVTMAMMMPILAILFSIMIPTESLSSNFANMILCRFQAFTVTTMKPIKFCFSHLAVWGIAAVCSAVCAILPIISMSVFIDGYTDTMLLDNIKLGVSYIAFCIGFDYIIGALTIKLKSRDKASILALGVGFGIGFVATLIALINDIEINLMGIFNAISDNWYYVAGGMAMLVAVGMALMLKFIRKGELS